MANLIIVCGPQAVGKMTVAENLRDQLKYNMMMNHDSIELSDRIFGFATPAQRELSEDIREKVFSLAVKHNVDLIFTYVCAFNEPEEREYLTSLQHQFEESGGRFIFVELSADLETRLVRNETPHRMERKASKRDVAPDGTEGVQAGRGLEPGEPPERRGEVQAEFRRRGILV